MNTRGGVQGLNPFAEIRKESLDIYNRLHSIEEDIGFMNTVHDAYSTLPLLPNLRCGAWYTDPARAKDVPAYFKSTDGHFGNWSFNLRRSNLHLLSIVVESSGIVLVDSTRSGKRIPDALSKTVPIWCSVINRAMLKRFPETQKGRWDVSLYTPPTSVSSQEHDQITRKLDEWADTLAKSSFELPELSRPLRPFWVTPATSSLPKFDMNAEARAYLPIVCVSASKQVQDGTERRSSGFSYIQGSGDDHELWGMGLSPQLFWQHKDALLATNRSDLHDFVSSLVLSQTSSPSSTRGTRAPEGIAKISNRISITSLSEIEPAQLVTPPPSIAFVLIDEVSATTSNSADSVSPQAQDAETLLTNKPSPGDTSSPRVPTQILKFEIPGGKKSQTYFLHSVLPTSLHFIGTKLSQGFNIVVACPSAKDLSAGVALGAISQFFDDSGTYIEDGGVNRNMTKQSIRTRLEWIIASCPRANPSRTTLKRVNEYLLTAEHLRR